MQKIIVGSKWYEKSGNGQYMPDSTAQVIRVNLELNSVRAIFTNDTGKYFAIIDIQSFLNDFVNSVNCK